MHVSISEINSFLACRRQWDFSSPHRRHLVPNGTAQALWLGEGVHVALEQFYRAGTDAADAFTKWASDQMLEKGLRIEDIRDSYELGLRMLEGYTENYGLTPDDDGDEIHVLVSEQEFQVPIPDTAGGFLVGRADGLLRDASGLYWLLEHKTYKQPPRVDTMALNLQILGYTWAFQQLSDAGAFAGIGVPPGVRIEGALYNGLRKQLPTPNVRLPLFMREWVSHTRAELASFERMLTQVYTEMLRPDLAVYPTPSKNCEWCAYRDPCILVQMQEDAEYMLESGYHRAEPRGVTYQDSEG